MPVRRLSERQRARIDRMQDRRRQRLEEEHATPVPGGEHPDQPRPGRIVVRHGADLAVEDEDGQVWHCLARQNLGQPVCGDLVVWHRSGPDRGVVTAILPRATLLARPDYSGRDKPLAANLTQVVVILAPQPEPSTYLLDQYLAAAERLGVRILIACNKMDLLDGPGRSALAERLAPYPRIGYPLLWLSVQGGGDPSPPCPPSSLDPLKPLSSLSLSSPTSSLSPLSPLNPLSPPYLQIPLSPRTLLSPLIAALTGQTSILVGQSGVGKSSLVKALLPDLDIQIGRLSAATGLGRHTTSAATCYRLPQGGYLIDSPGVRSFRLTLDGPAELEHGFREIAPLIGQCRFANCRHDQEPGCALKAAVSAGTLHPDRMTNFLHLGAALERASARRRAG